MYENQSRNEIAQIGYTLLEFLGSITLIYFISVTFGAYLIEDFYETLVFSIIMSLICFMPILIAIKHNDPFKLLERLLIQNEFKTRLEKNLVNISYGAIVGAWFGALVIPLDWDRWWQQWPISCLFGAGLGTIFGPFFSYIKPKNKIKQNL